MEHERHQLALARMADHFMLYPYHSYQQLDPPSSISSKTNVTRRRQAEFLQRWAVLLLSTISASASAAAMGLRWADITWDGDTILYSLVIDHRDSVQVFVSILASVLTLMLTYHICLAYNLTMRAKLASQKMSTSILRLHISLSRKSVDINLPLRLLIISIIVCGMLILPNWLWNGALTPQVSERTRNGLLAVPKTGRAQAGYAYLGKPPGIISDDCSYTWQINGSWTPCIARILYGRISDSMAQATIIDGNARNFSKFDNSGYHFMNRSYGAGASAGLVTLPEVGSIESYTYTELGYKTTSRCIYNQSSTWIINSAFTDNEIAGTPNMFLVNGTLPNQDDSFGYIVWNLGNTPEVVVAINAGSSGVSQAAVPPILLTMAAGDTYGFADKVQCELFFDPAWLDVSVFVNNQTIHVLPSAQIGALDPDPRGYLVEWVLQELKSLTMMGTMLYISPVGQALQNNLFLSRNSSGPMNITDPVNLLAIQDSINAAVDDILVALNSIALSDGRYWTTTDAQFVVSVVEIGSSKFLLAIFIVNMLVLAAISMLCIYTRMFTQSPAFDFADQVAMMAAVASGTSMTAGQSRLLIQDWDGDPAAKRLVKSTVQLRSKLSIPETPVVLMHAEDEKDSSSQHSDMEIMLSSNPGVIDSFHVQD